MGTPWPSSPTTECIVQSTHAASVRSGGMSRGAERMTPGPRPGASAGCTHSHDPVRYRCPRTERTVAQPWSDLPAFGLQGLDDGTISSRGQQVAYGQDLLDVDVLVLRTAEERGLGTDVNRVLAVMAELDRSDGFEQRQHGVPLDVVARRMLEDLEERLTVMGIVEVLGHWGRRHWTPLGRD